MTKPTITYGHGYLNDCDDISDWTTETRVNMADVDASSEVIHGDIYKLTAVFNDGVGTTEGFHIENATALNVNHVLYPKWILRYKTSEASLGAQAKVEARFQDGTTEILLNLSYSTTWTVLTGTFTKATSELDYIRFYAEGENDTPNGTYYTYYDFVLIHKGTFTLPNYAGGIEFSPPPRYAIISFNRVGDATQNLGSESATVNASCDLLIGTWTRTNDYVAAEVFYDIAHNSSTEPWQWLDTGTEQFKVTLEEPVIRRQGDSKILDLLFREYRLSDASNETYIERFGLNL